MWNANGVAAFLQRITIVDIVDIVLIAVFIYLILVWLKKARARFIFIGMIIVGSIYVLARVFNLYLTTMALQTFFAIALIMIIVIFQDDLRHFFERIAIIGVSRRYRRKLSFDNNVDMLTSAAINLSRKKIGALIVIRGIDPLDRHLEAGINLDGLLSQVLIESIFDRHAPSHDGAVILEASRITKFGAYLPLSTNIREVGRLGTRHAAALGIAERTDALSIVVSEEHGTVSIAEEGRLKQLADITHLQRILQDFYRKKFPQEKRRAFGSFLTRHFLEKVIALMLACGFWLVLSHRTELVRRDFVIPIEYRNLAPNAVISEPKPKEATATLSGTERDFDMLKEEDLKLSMDMTSVGDGENIMTITKEMVRHPTGLSIVNIEPETIALYVYKMVNTNIPIDIKVEGRVPSGVALRELRVEPKEITVVVPSTLPKETVVVTTTPIKLKEISETKTITPELILPPGAYFPSDKKPEVKVIVEIEKKD